MKTVRFGTRFRRDVKRMQKRGADLDELRALMKLLEDDCPLEQKYRNHELTGDLAGHKECHVRPDWLLIYRCHDDELYFERTGTHSDLFE